MAGETPVAHSQQNPDVLHGKLIAFDLPFADIRLDTGMFRVMADDLLPLGTKKAAAKKAAAPIEPSLALLADTVEKLPPYDIGSAELPFYHALAAYATQWLQLPAEASVANVSIYLLSEKGKLPFAIQARANTDFKKGELVLSPTTTSICTRDDRCAMGVREDTKILHPALIGYVPLAVGLQYTKNSPKRNPQAN